MAPPFKGKTGEVTPTGVWAKCRKCKFASDVGHYTIYLSVHPNCDVHRQLRGYKKRHCVCRLSSWDMAHCRVHARTGRDGT